MKKIHVTVLLLLFLLCIMQISCIHFKYSKSPDFDKYYTEFLINDSTTQVFIKPLSFESKKNSIAMDFTFRNNCSDTSTTKANFSFLFQGEQMTQIEFYNDDTLIKALPLKLIYKERKSDGTLFRLSAAVPNSSFQKILEAQDMEITLMNASDTLQFNPVNSTQRTLNRITFNMQDYLQCKQ